MVNLPANIIEDEILLRLPVQSLSRFKCVCKHWLHLIQSRSFIDRHYHRDRDGRLIICHYFSRHPSSYRFRWIQRFIETAAASNQFPGSNDDIVELMGPTLGVFCQVTLDGGITLFNPATRMHRRVPPLPAATGVPPAPLPAATRLDGRLPPAPALLRAYGFGYVDHDYKVVVLDSSDFPSAGSFSRFFCNYAARRSRVCIYSSANDSWKLIPNNFIQNNSNLSALHSRSSTFLNGVYYWLVPPDPRHLNDEIVHCVILSFDMRFERFREIQLPEGLAFGRDVDDKNICIFRNLIQICTQGDSIALLASKDSWVEMWVMDKEGFWSRSVRIRHGDEKLRPYCLWKNELVMGCSAYSDYLHLIDVSTEKIRKVAIPPVPKINHESHMHHAFFYKETLVSIEGERRYAD